MMRKIKHSKLRNTGVIFEMLVRQITMDVFKDKNESKAGKIIKEFFNEKNEIGKELQLYNSLVNKKYEDKGKADYFVNQIICLRRRLDENKIDGEKYRLIHEIKKHYNLDEFFKIKINNYKTLASIYKLFESSVNKDVMYDPEDITQSYYTILENIMVGGEPILEETESDKLLKEFAGQSSEDKKLTYQILINKFNKKYENLNLNQKRLLREYVISVGNIEVFNKFLIEEFKGVRNILKGLTDKITDDDVIKIKLNEVTSLLENINLNEYDKNFIRLMKYYNLIDELMEVGEN